MKKILYPLISLLFFVLILFTIILSTIGFETDKFNNLIIKKINQTQNNINLKISTIKFKLDIKEISLFVETISPQINYRKADVPTKYIRAYVDFFSLIKSNPKIKKINLVFNQIDIIELKKISATFKPSNLTSFINNKIKQGKFNTEIEIYLDNDNLLDNFIAKGSVTNFKTEVVNNMDLEKTSFSFFADKTDVLIKKISGEAGPINLEEGDLKLKLSPEIEIESNFKTTIRYNKKLKKYSNLIKDLDFAKDITNLEADLNNSFSINLDKTYKVKKYNFQSEGLILKSNLGFKKPLKNNFLNDEINQLSLINSKIKTNFSFKKNTTSISGKYLLNGKNPLLFNLENTIDKDLLKLKLNTEYRNPLELEIINYKKPTKLIANLFLNLEKQKNKIKINELNLTEGNNLISVKGLKLSDEKFLSLKKILVKTYDAGKKNNDFSISYGKKISIQGTHFDATNLPKFFKKKSQKNIIFSINKEIEVDFDNIAAPLSKKLKNFKLIGKIQKGKFTKISSKGDFGNNNFLDITMKKDQNSEKKYLEIFSDLPGPILSEYDFFKGLTGGKLLYSSIINKENYSSKLKIENFKVINAPGMVKLLSLADLGGLADLSVGEGLSFDTLEINMEKKKELLKLNEILALGPSISVLMEGYQDQDITSLKGTLIPAKTLNKVISKIPVIGDIIIPKEVGEGLFGISFKMKGPPGKIKTSINPIRTVTPRFIQKIIEKNKNSK
ncbi:hypothetical protein OAA82_01780 [Pelagibacteraceae bacterium]|nr:hypothetical protein [Pelagibacteraceae bacterium]